VAKNSLLSTQDITTREKFCASGNDFVAILSHLARVRCGAFTGRGSYRITRLCVTQFLRYANKRNHGREPIYLSMERWSANLRWSTGRKKVERLVRDLTDGQKLLLLSPRRFGKSSLVAEAFRQLQKQHVRTLVVPISS
jgi:hypothetical protein